MPTLLVVHPVTGERRVECSDAQLRGDGLVIGRSARSGLVLDDPTVSRLHACLHLLGGAVMVEDLGSTAGTTVNGRACCRTTPCAWPRATA